MTLTLVLAVLADGVRMEKFIGIGWRCSYHITLYTTSCLRILTGQFTEWASIWLLSHCTLRRSS